MSVKLESLGLKELMIAEPVPSTITLPPPLPPAAPIASAPMADGAPLKITDQVLGKLNSAKSSEPGGPMLLHQVFIPGTNGALGGLSGLMESNNQYLAVANYQLPPAFVKR
jgi:hypothetical protein